MVRASLTLIWQIIFFDFFIALFLTCTICTSVIIAPEIFTSHTAFKFFHELFFFGLITSAFLRHQTPPPKEHPSLRLQQICLTTEVIRTDHVIDDSLVDHKVMITQAEDYSTYKGTVTDVGEIIVSGIAEMQITVQKSRNNSKSFSERMIKFLEILN